MKPGEVTQPSPRERITCVRSSQDGGPFVFDMELGPKGKGPPMHSHDETDEHIEVLTGTIVFRVGRDEHRLGPGDQLTLPPWPPHTFFNPSKTDPVVCRVTHGARFERGMSQPDFTRMAIYITHVDPGASRMASPFVRGLLRLVAWVGRLRGIQPVG